MSSEEGYTSDARAYIESSPYQILLMSIHTLRQDLQSYSFKETDNALLEEILKKLESQGKAINHMKKAILKMNNQIKKQGEQEEQGRQEKHMFFYFLLGIIIGVIISLSCFFVNLY